MRMIFKIATATIVGVASVGLYKSVNLYGAYCYRKGLEEANYKAVVTKMTNAVANTLYNLDNVIIEHSDIEEFKKQLRINVAKEYKST